MDRKIPGCQSNQVVHCYGSACPAWNRFPEQPVFLPASLPPSLFPPSFFRLLSFLHSLCPNFCREFSFVTCFLSLISPIIVPQHQPGGSASTNSFWSLDSGSTFSSHHTRWFPLCIQMLQKKLLERKVRTAKGCTLPFCLQIHCPKKYLLAATRCGCHSTLLQRTVRLSPSSFGFTWREE